LADLTARVDAALARRADRLARADTDACRLFHSAADGIDGLVIEKLGDVLVVQLHEGRLAIREDAAHDLCEHAARRVGARAVYRKVYPRARSALRPNLERLHRDPQPWIGEPVEPELSVRENGITFLVRPYDGYVTGLFLDHCNNRARVRVLAAGRRVLNAFAYTCGFTVAAGVGGAAQTASVDLSRKSLEWGKRNLTANDLTLDRHRFFCCDVFDYYRRAARQGHRFDLIILDPPTFARARRPRRTFQLTRDLDRLARGAIGLLDAGGILLLSINHQGTPPDQLGEVLVAAARDLGRGVEPLAAPALPDDFRGDADYAKSVWLRLG
jgi:23S rRNA (cytosine1962-C5)-methyltransferase